jgi:hypothetical protein
MVRIVAVGAMLVAVMIAIKDHRLLERTHVVGSCSTVAQTSVSTDGSEWRSCVAGRLTGRPGLALAGCTDFGVYRDAEFWQCPATLAGNAIRQ